MNFNVLWRTCTIDEVKFVYTSRSMNNTLMMDCLTCNIIYKCIYRFTGSCGVVYNGRTTRHLSDGVDRHFSVLVCTTLSTHHFTHLLNTGHREESDSAYRDASSGIMFSWVSGHFKWSGHTTNIDVHLWVCVSTCAIFCLCVSCTRANPVCFECQNWVC